MTGITQLSGTTGNTTIDAMFVAAESFSVPVTERATLAGNTIAKWGGALGTGTTLTYSFADATSSFAPAAFQAEWVI